MCVSSTICVYRTAKWFKTFVRGTFETEKLRKLSGPDLWGTVRIEKTDCSHMSHMLRKIVKGRCDAESGASLSHRVVAVAADAATPCSCCAQ